MDPLMKFTISEPSNVYIFKHQFFNSVHPNWRQETFVRSGSAHIDAFLTRYVCLFVRLSVRSIDRSMTPRELLFLDFRCARRATLDVRPASCIRRSSDCVHFAPIENQKSKIHFFISFHPCDDDDDGNAPCVRRVRSFVSREDIDVGRHLRRPFVRLNVVRRFENTIEN